MKVEFSKKIVIAVLIWAMSVVTFSYVLSYLDKNPNEIVTSAVVTSVIGIIIGYFQKSFKEKDSRNKHRLDKNGIPFENA